MEEPEIRFAEAADGTRIAWRAHGDASRAGCPVILTNGLSTTRNFWKHLIPALASERRVVEWRYRGHAESEPARSGDYGIATHADDLRRVTEVAHGGGGAAIHVAFSMGVTVLLELFRRHPERVGAMVLIGGGADHPYASSRWLRFPGVRRGLSASLAALAPLAPAAAPVASRVSASPLAYAIARRTGTIGPKAPREDVEHFFRAFGEMDLRAYFATLGSLFAAHASDVLPRVRVPALVIAPERDVMALRKDLELLRDGLPGAEWTLVPGTGHALLLEAGDAVVARVQAFLRGLAGDG